MLGLIFGLGLRVGSAMGKVKVTLMVMVGFMISVRVGLGLV